MINTNDGHFNIYIFKISVPTIKMYKMVIKISLILTYLVFFQLFMNMNILLQGAFEHSSFFISLRGNSSNHIVSCSTFLDKQRFNHICRSYQNVQRAQLAP